MRSTNRHDVFMSAVDDPFFDVAGTLRVRKVSEVDDLIRETSKWALNRPAKPQMRRWLTSELQYAVSRSYPSTVVTALLHAARENTVGLRLDVVEPFAASESRSIRLAVAQDLSLAVRDSEAVITLLASLAEDSSPIVREWAIFMLGHCLYPARKRRMAVVFAALSDPSRRVRAEARFCVKEFAWSYSPATAQDRVRDVSHLAPADGCF